MPCALLGVLLGALMLVFVPGAARGDVTVTASVRRTTVSVDETFALTISVEGARSASAPDMTAISEHFSVRSSGSSTNMSMINGRITQSKSFAYVLLPRDLGTFTLGPVRVELGNAEYLSNTIDITVIDGGAPAAPAQSDVRESSERSAGRDVFATTGVDRRVAYVDEQITLSFKYYRRAEPRRQPRYEPPDLTGFWAEDLDAREEYIEVVEGKRYRVTEIKTGLFGAASGTATIGPATLVYYEEGPSFTFFAGPGERRELRTDPVEIEIRRLPAENRPVGFGGAVGRYDLAVSVDVTSVEVMEPLTLTVTIRGEGNIRTVPAPDLSGLADFRVYESGSSTEVTRKNGVLGGVKRYEFVLVPEAEGEHTIPPIELAYFDPSTERYAVTRAPARTIDALPGTGDSEAAGGAVRTGIERVGSGIRYIREPSGSMIPVGSPLHSRSWFLLLQLVPPAAFGMTVFLKRRGDKLRGDVRLVSYRDAASRARKTLKEAADAFAGDRRADGCSAVARAVVDFIGDRTGSSTRGMTLDELGTTLRNAGADDALVGNIRALVTECDLARFAGGAGGVDSRKLTADAEGCIRTVERLTRETGRSGTRGGGTRAIVLFLVLSACVILPGPVATAQDQRTERFRHANSLYAGERFAEAAAEYQEIVDDGFGTADVYYNLGNALFKLGRTGHTVLAYERALRIEPGHDDARANLAFVRGRLADRQAPIEDGALAAFVRGVYSHVHISTLAATASALLFALFGTLIVGVLRGRVAGWPLRAAVTLLMAFALVAAATGARIHGARTADDAVVLVEELAARTGPSEDFVLEFRIHEGTTVAVKETRGDWSRIAVSGTDLTGWVPSEGLEEIRRIAECAPSEGLEGI